MSYLRLRPRAFADEYSPKCHQKSHYQNKIQPILSENYRSSTQKWSFGRPNVFYKVNNLVVDIECPSWKSQFQRNVFLEGGCFRKENIFEFLTMHFILFNFEIGGYWTWSFSLNPFESSLDQMILFLVWVKEATKCTSSQGQVKILKSNL